MTTNTCKYDVPISIWCSIIKSPSWIAIWTTLSNLRIVSFCSQVNPFQPNELKYVHVAYDYLIKIARLFLQWKVFQQHTDTWASFISWIQLKRVKWLGKFKWSSLKIFVVVEQNIYSSFWVAGSSLVDGVGWWGWCLNLDKKGVNFNLVMSILGRFFCLILWILVLIRQVEVYL